MEDVIVFDPPSNYNRDDLFPGDAEPLAVPPLDYDMLGAGLSWPENFPDSDFDLDFDLEELGIDDLLCDPAPVSNSESVDHHSSLSQLPCVNSDQNSLGFDPGCADVGVASNHGTDRGSDGPRVSDTEHGYSDRDSSGHVSSHDFHNGGCNLSKASDYRSSVSDSEWKSNYPSPESGSCDQLCSRGSGECNSGVSPMENPPSPDSCNGVRDFSRAENFPANGLVESKTKFEDLGSDGILKRKKGQQEEGILDTRTSKFRKSFMASENANTSENLIASNDEDDKRKARLIRNRESAQLSRQRKKQYVEELEDKVRSMHSTINELNSKISYFMAENATLRQQLSGNGACPPPPPGMYPMAPMGYSWMAYPPYVVKPQGSLAPLVPIPRLQSRPTSASKVSKKSEKSGKKKSEGKTKKVASISFLGLLFFMLLFGGLVPIVNVRYGGIGGKFSNVDRFSDPHKGRTLMVDGGRMGYSDGKRGHEHEPYKEKYFGGISLEEEHKLQFKAGTNGSVAVHNSSEPLVASLYVPRNDKLVRIDGNLIIHSVLASEKARTSHVTGEMKTSEETRVAIVRNYIPTNHAAGAGRNNGRSTSLGCSSPDNLEPSASDVRLQQWFREDLAGPLLSSGMCTEVFRFDVSPSPGSIVPATSVTNITSEYRLNSTKLNSSRNRRILRGHSIPLNGHAVNLTDKPAELNTDKGGLQGNRSSSSIVVSVLVDPREAGDVDGEGMMRSKPLSRIFVVLLIDSVKYVTYSCMLPLMGSSPHLVTA